MLIISIVSCGESNFLAHQNTNNQIAPHRISGGHPFNNNNHINNNNTNHLLHNNTDHLLNNNTNHLLHNNTNHSLQNDSLWNRSKDVYDDISNRIGNISDHVSNRVGNISDHVSDKIGNISQDIHDRFNNYTRNTSLDDINNTLHNELDWNNTIGRFGNHTRNNTVGHGGFRLLIDLIDNSTGLDRNFKDNTFDNYSAYNRTIEGFKKRWQNSDNITDFLNNTDVFNRTAEDFNERWQNWTNSTDHFNNTHNNNLNWDRSERAVDEGAWRIPSNVNNDTYPH